MIAQKEQGLKQTRAQRAEVLDQLVEDRGDRRKLAEEHGRLLSTEQLEAAELRELRLRQASAWVDIFVAKEVQAQAEFNTYNEEVTIPAKRALDEAIRAQRAGQNAGRTKEDREKMARLRVEKAEAKANLAEIIGPHSRDLKNQRDIARRERAQAEAELSIQSWIARSRRSWNTYD